MTIFCNIEIIDSLKDIDFPKTKSEIISYIGKVSDINEASMISLNKLEDRIYHSTDEICENIKIACNLEIKDALIEMRFPATKNDIMDYVRYRNFSDFVINSLDAIPERYIFNNISDICK